jgi:hypothetical protein
MCIGTFYEFYVVHSPCKWCNVAPKKYTTGWGQRGDPTYVHSAGHDNNYIALSGTLDLFRRGHERPMPPANFAGDYAGGGVRSTIPFFCLMCIAHVQLRVVVK